MLDKNSVIEYEAVFKNKKVKKGKVTGVKEFAEWHEGFLRDVIKGKFPKLDNFCINSIDGKSPTALELNELFELRKRIYVVKDIERRQDIYKLEGITSGEVVRGNIKSVMLHFEDEDSDTRMILEDYKDASKHMIDLKTEGGITGKHKERVVLNPKKGWDVQVADSMVSFINRMENRIDMECWDYREKSGENIKNKLWFNKADGYVIGNKYYISNVNTKNRLSELVKYYARDKETGEDVFFLQRNIRSKNNEKSEIWKFKRDFKTDSAVNFINQFDKAKKKEIKKENTEKNKKSKGRKV